MLGAVKMLHRVQHSTWSQQQARSASSPSGDLALQRHRKALVVLPYICMVVEKTDHLARIAAAMGLAVKGYFGDVSAGAPLQPRRAQCSAWGQSCLTCQAGAAKMQLLSSQAALCRELTGPGLLPAAAVGGSCAPRCSCDAPMRESRRWASALVPHTAAAAAELPLGVEPAAPDGAQAAAVP